MTTAKAYLASLEPKGMRGLRHRSISPSVQGPVEDVARVPNAAGHSSARPE